MQVKHLTFDLYEFQVPISILENIPFFQNFLEDLPSSTLPTCLYLPATLDSDQEMISLFFSLVSEKLDKGTTSFDFQFTIFELCELFKISFSLECDDFMTLFAKKIGEMFMEMNMDELFEITLTREFFEKTRDPLWKKKVQENLLLKSKPDDFITCVYHLPSILKQKIYANM